CRIAEYCFAGLYICNNNRASTHTSFSPNCYTGNNSYTRAYKCSLAYLNTRVNDASRAKLYKIFQYCIKIYYRAAAYNGMITNTGIAVYYSTSMYHIAMPNKGQLRNIGIGMDSINRHYFPVILKHFYQIFAVFIIVRGYER